MKVSIIFFVLLFPLLNFAKTGGPGAVPCAKKISDAHAKVKYLHSRSGLRDNEFALIIGFVNRAEKVFVTKDSVVNGNILILNRGSLAVNPAVNFTVNGFIILIDSAIVSASQSGFELNGNLILANHSEFKLLDSRFSMKMQYRYQYNIIALDTSVLNLSGCKINFDKGSWTGTFMNHSSLIMEMDSFDQTVTILMKNESKLLLNNVYNAWEFLLADSVEVNISSAQNLILWFYIHKNQDVEFSFPQGIWLNRFVLNNSQPGMQDVGYSVLIDSTANVNWGILQESNSSLKIKDSYMRTFGLIFDTGGADTVEGFYNKQFYSNSTFKTLSHNVQLVNSAVESWNFYAMQHTSLAVSGCVFGEALSFENSNITVFGSVCDGSGGYIGANEATLLVFAAELEAQLLAQGKSFVIINESEIDMKWLDIIFTGSSVGLFLNTVYNDNIIVLDTAFVLELSLDSFRNRRIGEIVEISGSVNSYKGPYNPSFVREYNLSYSRADDSLKRKMIAYGLTAKKSGEKIISWNTDGLVPGYYYLYMSAYLNQDADSIEVAKKVWLGKASGIEKNDKENIKIFVSDNRIFITGTNEYLEKSTLILTGLQGRTVYSSPLNTGSNNIDLSFLPPGIYLATLITGKKTTRTKILLK